MSYWVWIWILISFLLHIITIFGLLIVYQRIQGLYSQESPAEHQLQEQLQSYLKQIERENEAYYRKMVQYINEREQNWTAKLQSNQPASSPSFSSATNQENAHDKAQAKQGEGVPSPQPSLKQHTPEEVEQVLALLKQGYSHQEIARRLHRGVGEIQLMVNLFAKPSD